MRLYVRISIKSRQKCKEVRCVLQPGTKDASTRQLDALLASQGSTDRRRGRKQEKIVQINPEIVEGDCDRTIQEMEAAYLSDLESNQLGKPAISKLQIVNKVLLKLKNPVFAGYFLDKGGLEQFHSFLKRLPDGSWPLSQVRVQVLQALLSLPYNEHHLKYTKLGKTLTALQHSKGEYEENKKIIQEIKDRWSRIVCGIRMEYSNLENFEKENVALMKKKRRRANFPTSEELMGDKNGKMGFNFTIRPYSSLNKREPTRSEGPKTEEIDKYLSRIRKLTKQN